MHPATYSAKSMVSAFLQMFHSVEYSIEYLGNVNVYLYVFVCMLNNNYRIRAAHKPS